MAFILVVDREEGPAGALASALEQQGYEVARVGDTAATFSLVRERTPHLVVLDLMQATEDQDDDQPEGVKLLAQLYLDHPEVPLIVYSSETSYKEQFWSWAAAAHLDKSRGPDQVTAVVEELLGEESGEPGSRG
jgi:DNA-binding response OmpR family regulator